VSHLHYSHGVRALRSRMAVLAVFALGCQAVLLGIPVADSFRTGLHGERTTTECTCGRAGHENAICPMHHGPAATPGSHDSDCRVSNAAGAQLDFVLATGVLPEPPPLLALPIQQRHPIAVDISGPPTRSAALDPPPPRL
jgi:hypothetical protein